MLNQKMRRDPFPVGGICGHASCHVKEGTYLPQWLEGYMNVGGMLPKEGRLQIGCAE
jgi:hypothetical protein